MRIVIDLQGAQTESRFRGIGRYSLSLSLAMARNAGAHEVWLALSAAFPQSILDIRAAFAGLVPPERIRVFRVPTPAAEIDPANAWRARAGELIREHFLLQIRPDWVFIPSLFEGYVDDAVTSIAALAPAVRVAVTVHDLIPLLDPARYLATEIQKAHYARKMAWLKQADLLLAVSDSSMNEALAALDFSADRVVSTSEAVDAHFRPISLSPLQVEALGERYGIQGKFIMYAPGGFDARKNLDGLITAYALLPAETRAAHQLVIVSKIQEGDRLNLRGRQRAAGLADAELVLTGYVPDEDLIALYNLATLFVFPSRHEGFGLPALEAMACGAPTIGSNTTSIPEVIGWAEALFDPDDPQAMADAMARVLGDESWRLALRAHAVSQAVKFSWDASARRALSAIETFQSGAARGSKEGVESLRNSGGSTLIDALAGISGAPEPSDRDLASAALAISFNASIDGPRQLLLDVSELVQRDARTGIQRVVRSLLKELLIDPPAGYVARPIYFDGRQYRYAASFLGRFLDAPGPQGPDDLVEFSQGDAYLALDLNATLTDAVHDFHAHLKCLGIHLYFVVYDILLVQRPDWWPPGTSDVFARWLGSISKVSTALICISDSVAHEVRNWVTGHPAQRPDALQIRSFHLGADVGNSMPTRGFPEDAPTVLAALQAHTSFLMVGTVEPRKGHAQALAAFERLWDAGSQIDLVLVGKKGWLVDGLVDRLRAHPELGKRLFWLEGISDEYLEAVYAASTCLLVPSEGEGFGLPLIEAAQHRKPIIARDLPVFREVAAEHAYYFSGLAPVALADAIAAWLDLHEKDESPGSTGMKILSWRESAAQLKKQLIELDHSG